MLRNSQVMGRHIYTLNCQAETRKDFWQEFLLQYYLSYKSDSACCTHLYLPYQIDEHALYEKALQNILDNKIAIKSKMPKAFAPWYEMAVANAKNALEKKLADNAEINAKLETLAELVGCDEIELIECFDISHTHGKETVGSCVVLWPVWYGKKFISKL